MSLSNTSGWKVLQHDRLKEDCPIHLLPHQIQHCVKIWNLLVKGTREFSYIDTSGTGAGKTVASLWIAWHLQKLYGIKTMVVGPSDVSLEKDDGWLPLAEEYGVEIEIATTYRALIGGRGTVSHPWLEDPNPEDKKDWQATEAFSKLCKKGLFIILDEAHHAKNDSQSHYAVAALVREAKKHKKSCRVGVITHTPGDKIEVYSHLLRVCGIITSIRLFEHIPFTKEYITEGYGLSELASKCKALAPHAAKDISYRLGDVSKTKAEKICRDFYVDYLKTHITFAMPTPDKGGFTVTSRNAFLKTGEDDLLLIEEGIRILKEGIAWNDAAGEAGDKALWSLGTITQALKTIETGKIGVIARHINEQCVLYPNKKFVVCCGDFCKENQYLLQSLLTKKKMADRSIFGELRALNPLWKGLPRDMMNMIMDMCDDGIPATVMNGDVKPKDRVKMIRDFQAPNTNTWCLIVSPGTGSESISLHDVHGANPRDMYIVPTYFFTKICQAAGRINRVGIQSDATINIVYSQEATLETKMIDSMARKSATAKDMIANGQKVLYPGEYPFYFESGEPTAEARGILGIL